MTYLAISVSIMLVGVAGEVFAIMLWLDKGEVGTETIFNEGK
jgi:hypothetical protein